MMPGVRGWTHGIEGPKTEATPALRLEKNRGRGGLAMVVEVVAAHADVGRRSMATPPLPPWDS